MDIQTKSLERRARLGHFLAASIACLFTLTAPVLARSSQNPQTGVAGSSYIIRFDHWSDQDERDFGEFIAGIGNSGCTTVDACLRDPSNPFRASDMGGFFFQADCAKLMYVLRAYFAWKRGLPFSYANGVAPVGGGADARYSPQGNRVTSRADVLTGSATGYALLNNVLSSVSSANYRVHPDLDSPLRPDFYSIAIDAKSVRPGTAMYDPNGHVGIVYKVESDGRIRLLGSHPDNTLTRDYYDLRFVRSRPGVGAGFKNWRPVRLVGYSRRSDGALVGGHIELAANSEIPDFSDEQYYGNGQRPTDEDWASGTFTLNSETVDYYDYVRAKIAGGRLEFDPLKEVADMVDSNCSDLHDRVQAVEIALQAGIQNRPEPDRLPRNIYGTSGDWETYSTPSRDARLKTAFNELRNSAQRFVEMYKKGDTTHLRYSGSDLVDDLIAVHDRETSKCSLSYTRTNGAPVTLPYEDARKRLFLISFDPYQCVERRWGATDPQELSSCRDDATKRDWYVAEQNLRNQIDRTYDARMDFSLAELSTPGPGKGVATPPDTDARAYLLSVRGTMAPPPSARTAPEAPPAVTVSAASPPSSADLDGWRSARTAEYAQWRSGHGYSPTEGASYARTEGPYGDGSQNLSPSRGTDPQAIPRPANAAIWDDPEAPEMMVIRAGSFIMGSPPDEIGRRIYEGPQHRVEVRHPFALSRDLVTFNEWEACAAEGGCRQYHPPDQHWGRGEHPVINVSWNDAQNYIAWLNAKTGKSYRLPSEAEWEYAARAGTTTPYYQGYTLTTDQANYDGVDFPRAGSPGTYRQATTPVGSFPANGFGLTDMEGNVWEWTQDCWNADYRAAHMPTDGAPWMSGDCDRRVVRAGAFNTSPAFARSAYRFWEVGELRSAFMGFRVARNL